MASEVVSVVAAVASVAAAAVAAWGAARASTRADGIDRRRHMIEAHDAGVDSFQAAHAAFMDAVAVVGHGANTVERIGSVGPVLARMEVLATHPLASDDVTQAGQGLTQALAEAFAAGDGEGLGKAAQQHLDELRVAVRAVYVATDAERTRLLAELTAPAWWRRRR